jgi:hypothetical protein
MRAPLWGRRLGYAIAAGIALGAAARIVMRLIALNAGSVEDFSWGGTIEVVVLAVAIGTPIALFFLALRSHLEWPKPWGGVALGTSLFAATALRPLPSAQSALAGTADSPLATAALFAALWIGYGLLLESFHARLSRSISQ